jgi:hypothetical protein
MASAVAIQQEDIIVAYQECTRRMKTPPLRRFYFVGILIIACFLLERLMRMKRAPFPQKSMH